jgi:multiple antibiotic resistance protein
MTLVYCTVVLFLIMDPVGNIASFLSLLKDLPPQQRRMIIIREMLIALAVMIVFYFLGEFIFRILNVSETTLRLASGVILFLVAIKILFPAIDSIRANLPAGEPFISPLAIPLIAGPSLLATIMLFAHLVPGHLSMLGAIFLSWILAVIVLLSSGRLQSVVGTNGLMACERLMGLVLIMLSIQRFLEGVQQFVKACN